MRTWPKDAFRDVDSLVSAGFFYDGHKDRVVCFSCGGALGNWDQNDDPLVEHVRWYPNCSYVNFCLDPGKNAEIAKLQQEVLQAEDEEAFDITEIDNAIAKVLDQSYLEFYKSFNITQEVFRKAVIKLLKQGLSVSDIAKSHIEKALQDVTGIKNSTVKVTKKPASPPTRNVCAVCLDGDKSVLFLPCQHLVACVNCAAAVSNCPMCRTPITKAVRAFFC